jgi:hypothetical protein
MSKEGISSFSHYRFAFASICISTYFYESSIVPPTFHIHIHLSAVSVTHDSIDQ